MIDEQVRAAMVKWPDVPAVFGWLRLDRRGQWWLIDRGRPDFDERLHGLGSPITSPPILDFIGRNYEHDDSGRWYWQNGPQRVFVDLDLAPLILRVIGEGRGASLVTHTGWRIEHVIAVSMTADGVVFVDTAMGPSAIHDLDLGALDFDEDAQAGPDHAGGVWLAGQRHPIELRDPQPASAFVARPRADKA